MSKNSADQRDLALHPSSSMRRRLRRSPTASPAPCSAHPHRRIVPMCAPRRGLLRWHSTPTGREGTAGPHSGNAGVAWPCLCVFGRDDPRRARRSGQRSSAARFGTFIRGIAHAVQGHLGSVTPHCRDICPRNLQCDGRQPNFEESIQGIQVPGSWPPQNARTRSSATPTCSRSPPCVRRRPARAARRRCHRH